MGDAAATVTGYEKWEAVKVHRSQVLNAPYNPRKIGEKARAKLKKNIARVGLIDPPVWNRRTGNLVGGHQRIAAVDSLHKSADYTLTVAAVDLTDQQRNQYSPSAQSQSKGCTESTYHAQHRRAQQQCGNQHRQRLSRHIKLQSEHRRYEYQRQSRQHPVCDNLAQHQHG